MTEDGDAVTRLSCWSIGHPAALKEISVEDAAPAAVGSAPRSTALERKS